jgi:hypothetical protein
VIVPASDRRALERICRYLARPPLAQDRLELTDQGEVVLHFKRAWHDGTNGIVLSRGRPQPVGAAPAPGRAGPPSKDAYRPYPLWSSRAS